MPANDSPTTVSTAGGWQLALGDIGEPHVDASFGTLERDGLDDIAWVDLAPGWVSATEPLYAEIVRTVPFETHTRWIYDRRVTEPRLTARWGADQAPFVIPGLVAEIRELLSTRYEVDFDSIGFALYRDGRDSVAWHGDTIGNDDPDALVAIVSLGSKRRFLMRPVAASRAGRATRPSQRYELDSGDLIVMGRCQKTWEHAIPKVAAAGPRISLSFRHS